MFHPCVAGPEAEGSPTRHDDDPALAAQPLVRARSESILCCSNEIPVSSALEQACACAPWAIGGMPATCTRKRLAAREVLSRPLSPRPSLALAFLSSSKAYFPPYPPCLPSVAGTPTECSPCSSSSSPPAPSPAGTSSRVKRVVELGAADGRTVWQEKGN